MSVTPGYTLLYPDAPGMARIACCESFDAVRQARADGCDAALWRSAETIAWHERMKASLDAKSYDEKQAIIKSVSNDMAAATGLEGYADAKASVGAKLTKAHVDSIDADFEAVFTTAPTTIIRTKKPTFDGAASKYRWVFPMGEGKAPIPVIKTSNRALRASPAFSLMQGTMVVFFGPDSIAHSIPDMPKRTKRARVFLKGSVPS